MNARAHSCAGVGCEICVLTAERDVLKVALDKINEIRNSIVGLQSINWSAHIYPLVAALDEAGIEGTPYDRARPHYISLLDRAEQAEACAAAIREALEEIRACADREDAEGRLLDATSRVHSMADTALFSDTGKRAAAVLSAAHHAREMHAEFQRASLRSGEGTVGGPVVNRYDDALEALWRACDAPDAPEVEK